MGLVFDKKYAQAYEDWHHSAQGRAIDGSIERLILKLLEPRPGERVLDVGCGLGNHLLILSGLGLDLNGVDASAHMINHCGQRLGQTATLKVGTADDLPYDDNAFDFSLLINSLEFMDTPLKVLREAGRVAKRKVFVGMINPLSWNGLIRRTRAAFGDPLFGHADFYNFWQIKSLLKQALGPVPIQWECIKVQPLLVGKWIPFLNHSRCMTRSPFGFFLGFSATLVYRFKTDNLGLKIKIRKPRNSLVGASFDGFNTRKGDQKDERGLPV